MTPPALTPAARGSRNRPPAQPTDSRPPAHRPAGRRGTSPRAPRRVSGPVGGLAREQTAPRTERTAPRTERTAPRTERTAPRIERTAPRIERQAQPWRRPRRPASAPASAPRRSVPALAVSGVRALPDHPLLDRVIRGRIWIPLLGVLLAGIVAMQVEVLKLNAGIGRAIEQGNTLQIRNELLRASVAGLADDQRIESLAAQMGLVMPSPAAVRFLSPGGSDIQHAMTDIQAPDPTSFATLLAADDPAPAAAGATAATGAATSSTGT